MLNENERTRCPGSQPPLPPNDDFTVWTMKLREDAVFQDGTPITAADFKAYWEHGAKPVNIIAWGGASLTLGEHQSVGRSCGPGIQLPMRRGSGSSTTIRWKSKLAPAPTPALPLYMAAWHVGISKFEQLLADDNWGNAPIGAGPFSLAYDPETGLTELTHVDLVSRYWNGPNQTPIIEKLVLPNIEDEQTRLLMFENGELDVIYAYGETYEAALDPGHPFNPLLHESPYSGLWFIRVDNSVHPLHDLPLLKALAHGVDMESIVRAVWGPAATHAKGLIPSLMPCHNPDADYQPYDPDLARQHLSESTFGSGTDLPPLRIDLHRPNMVAMGVAMKEYWKDNLDVDLDILKREDGVDRRGWTHFFRISLGFWIPDPMQIVNNTRLWQFDAIYSGPPPPPTVLEMLAEQARSLGLDDPDRCAAFQAFEERYFDEVHMIPIREVDPVRWVVQPWLRGFESTFNLDFNTLTTAYVARH